MNESAVEFPKGIRRGSRAALLRKVHRGAIATSRCRGSLADAMTTLAAPPTDTTALIDEELFQLQLRIARRADELARQPQQNHNQDLIVWLEAERDVFRAGVWRERGNCDESVKMPAGAPCV